MPEAAELKLTAKFINKMTQFRLVEQITTSLKTKNQPFDFDRIRIVHGIDMQRFANITAYSRGKELILQIYKFDKEIFLRMSMGMSGHFQLTKQGCELPKHSHLQFLLDNGDVLCYVDARRFGKWKIMTEMKWSENRGPDVFELKNHQMMMLSKLNDKKYANSYLFELILSQKLFNGVGNYLRAEIFYHSNINPFHQVKDLSDVQLMFLISSCTNIAQEAFELGGGQLKDWKNPFGQEHTSFREWIKVYGKGSSIKDKFGRRFWFDEKWKATISYEYYCVQRAQ